MKDWNSAGLKLMAAASMTLLFSLIPACGSAAAPTPAPATATPRAATLQQPTAASGATATLTAAPVATSTPHTVSGKDSITLVVNDEPVTLDGFSAQCTATPELFPCGDYVTDTLTYISEETRQVIPLSATEKWEQAAPNRWRFTLRQGVKFQNGEPFDSAAAKFAIDLQGSQTIGALSVSYTGAVSAEAIDSATVDVVCEGPCPIYPKTAFLTRFEAPAWYQAASEEERTQISIGLGPYQVTEWRPGERVAMESYPGYLARTDVAEAQAPHIKSMTQFNRKEASVRAAMVKAGEADWAFDIGAEGAAIAPDARVGGAAEMVVMKVDTIWHPLLKKKEFRLALAHAMDCPTIIENLYGDYTACSGNSAPRGSLGLTAENERPYEYDPEQAKELLRQAGYNGEEINFYYQLGRFYKDNEMVEAIGGYWKEAGVNVELQAVDANRNNDLGRSGCGRYDANPLDCMNQPPPPPAGVSPHIIISTPSLETLDYGKIALQTLSCANIRSYVCEPGRLEPLIARALAATGDERKELMEQIATFVHDDALLIGVFESFVVYGVAPDLNWEPRYDRRVRLNMMSFKN